MLNPMENRTILSSTGKHDLRAIQFSRRGAFLCILEDDQDRQLYLSISRSPNMWMQRKNLVRMVPVVDNKEVPYEYDVEPSRLIIHTYRGDIELCFDEGGRLRVRGKGAALRFCFEMMLFENACPRENGDWEIAFMILGKLLFVPLKGALFCNGRWKPAKSRADDFILELIPSVETGMYEAAVHEYRSNGVRLAQYPSFEECQANALADFEAYAKRFPQLSPEYAQTARLAAWVIWMHTLGPGGLLKDEVVYMTRTQWLRAFGWQQSFQAMAASGDIRAAWRLLLTIFDYQDEAGQIPDSVGDLGAAYMVTKPALQGLALEYLLDRGDIADIPLEACEKLYEKLAKFAEWWLVFRDRNHSGLPQYYHADESPGEFCSIFRDGLPMYSPDLIAFVALLTEACARLARHLGMEQKSTEWQQRSDRLVERLVKEFWNGERFVARSVRTGKAVDSECFMCMLPMMLGKKLPEEIIDEMVRQLMDEDIYMAEGGIMIESRRQARKLDMTTPGPSGSAAYVNVLIGVGLWKAGRKELALDLARRSVGKIMEMGFGFMGSSEPAEDDGRRRLEPACKKPSTVARWSSWTAACFFILARMLCEGAKEEE